MKKGLLYFASLSFLLLACASPQKVMETGNYDEALRLASNRIRGKKEFKLKHVLVLEEAFRKAHERDLRKIEMLKSEGRSENWPTIYSVYERIDKRQNLIEPFIPVYADNGYKAEFRFIRTNASLINARSKAAEHFYVLAKDLLNRGEGGDMYAAREAYSRLNDIRRYFREYKDVDLLKNRALELGTEEWLVRMANNTGFVLPRHFESRVMSLGARDFDSRWRRFSTRAIEGVDYDYEVNLVLDEINISPEVSKERQFDESKEVEDGFDYVLDANGNVMKDTLGNDIKVTRYTWISATVVEVHQLKSAIIEGRVIVKDRRSKDILRTERVFVDNTFENYASTLLRGNPDALSKDTRRRLGNSPRPFPSDENMLLDAVDRLKDELSRFLRGPLA